MSAFWQGGDDRFRPKVDMPDGEPLGSRQRIIGTRSWVERRHSPERVTLNAGGGVHAAMEVIMPDSLSLDDVLRMVNELGDWMDSPAKTASDRGAYEDYPLHKIAIWGDVPAAEVLIDNGADVNCAGEDNDTPLHRALMGRHAEMVRFLISRGADRDRPNVYGHTARDRARDLGNPDISNAMQ
jgi:uncharacterized protein